MHLFCWSSLQHQSEHITDTHKNTSSLDLERTRTPRTEHSGKSANTMVDIIVTNLQAGEKNVVQKAVGEQIARYVTHSDVNMIPFQFRIWIGVTDTKR